MLQNIRDKSQGWLAWLIVIVLCVTFILWGIHAYVTSSHENNIAASVNQLPITQQEINATYERLRQQQQMQLGADFSLNPAIEARLKRQALDQLIISRVLVQSAHKAKYRVTTNQVDEQLLRIPAFQVNGQFSVDRFHEILNSVLYTQNQFLSDLRDSMLINQVEGGYINSAFVLPSEISTAIKLVNQKRDISYMIIPASRFTKDVHLNKDEIKNYYQNHLNEFQVPEKVKVAYIKLSLDSLKNNLHFDKTKLQQYYENNLQNYMQPASWHVAHILIKFPSNPTTSDIETAQNKINTLAQRIKSGESFAKLAEKYSDDKVSARRGGALDWFTMGTLDPNFEKVVANLQKPGDVSQPIRTNYGFSLIKLLDVKKAKVKPFKDVEAQVKNTLAQQQAEQLFTEKSDKLTNLTYANPNSLDLAAKALSFPIEITDFFDRNGTKQGITASPRFVTAAFSTDVLQQGNNSDLIQIDPNTVVVLRVTDHKPATTQSLAEVQNIIEPRLISQKAQILAKQFGESIVAKLQAKTASFQKISSELHLSWQIDRNAGRHDSHVDATILAQAFHMPRPEKNLASISGLNLPSGDYAVIAVNTVHDGDLSVSDNVERRIFREEMEKNLGRIDYELYVKQNMDKAKIKLGKDIIHINTNAES